jgi:hypothetical protein
MKDLIEGGIEGKKSLLRDLTVVKWTLKETPATSTGRY